MKKIDFDYVNWNEFEHFLDCLPDKDAAKLVSTIQKIEEYGLSVAVRQEWVKKLDKNLYEIRSKRSTNIQRALYFQVVDTKYVITHGFTKKTQKTPPSEISTAKKQRDFYLANLRRHHNEQNR